MLNNLFHHHHPIPTTVGNENVIILNPTVWDIPAVDLTSKKYLVLISVVSLIHRYIKGTVSVFSSDPTFIAKKYFSYESGKKSSLLEYLLETPPLHLRPPWTSQTLKTPRFSLETPIFSLETPYFR